MHLPMTSIQDAWGVYTLDDRSDTTISVPKACKSNYQSLTNNKMYTPEVRIAKSEPQEIFISAPHTQTDESQQQLLGMLNLLLIFILIDKLFAIWNKS